MQKSQGLEILVVKFNTYKRGNNRVVCGTPRSHSQPPLLEYSSLPRNFSKLSFSFSLFLSFALKNLSFSLQLSRPIVEEPKKEREMASFSEAPPGDPKVGEKIFKTKCAQCHTVDKGAGHKQGIHFFFLLIYLFLYIFDLVAACLDLSDKLKFKVCDFSSCMLDFCCVVLIC